jgi:fumarate hydratase subunit alpha
MPITSAQIQSVTAALYERSLKKIPEDTKAVLRKAQGSDSSETARKTLTIMLQSADAAGPASKAACARPSWTGLRSWRRICSPPSCAWSRTR